MDVEKCEKCGGPVRIIVDASNRSIEDLDVIQKILKHLRLDQDSDPKNRSPPSVTVFVTVFNWPDAALYRLPATRLIAVQREDFQECHPHR